MGSLPPNHYLKDFPEMQRSPRGSSPGLWAPDSRRKWRPIACPRSVGYNLTSILPVLAPLKRPKKAAGVFSMPS